jgi:hypothetical protein
MNLKVIMAAMSAAALLASPAMAKTKHPNAASAATTLDDVHGAAVPYRAANEGGSYTPSKPVPPSGPYNDFHDNPGR